MFNNRLDAAREHEALSRVRRGVFRMRCVPDILLKGSRWSPIARGVGEIGEQAFLFSAFKKLSHIGRIPPMPGCT